MQDQHAPPAPRAPRARRFGTRRRGAFAHDMRQVPQAVVTPDMGLYRVNGKALSRLHTLIGCKREEIATHIHSRNGAPLPTDYVTILERGGAYISPYLAQQIAEWVTRMLTSTEEGVRTASTYGLPLVWRWTDFVQLEDTSFVPAGLTPARFQAGGSSEVYASA